MGACDGAGGYPQGDEASYLISELAINFLKDSKRNYLEHINDLNEELKKKLERAKTTFTLCHYKEDHFYFLSIGDSEIIVFDEEDILYQNISHSPIGFQVQAGTLEEEEALQEPGRNIVSFLLGDKVFHIDSSSKFKFEKGMTLVCGSDGLFDNFTYTEIQEHLDNGFEEGTQEIKEACDNQLNRETWYKDDDICFFIIRKK